MGDFSSGGSGGGRQQGGVNIVNISGSIGNIGGDIVGGDKIVATMNPIEISMALALVEAALASGPPEAAAKLVALKQEAAKGKGAEDDVVAKLVDGLVGLVPGAASAVVGAFATPILGGIAGPVTKFVLDKLQGK